MTSVYGEELDLTAALATQRLEELNTKFNATLSPIDQFKELLKTLSSKENELFTGVSSEKIPLLLEKLKENRFNDYQGKLTKVLEASSAAGKVSTTLIAWLKRYLPGFDYTPLLQNISQVRDIWKTNHPALQGQIQKLSSLIEDQLGKEGSLSYKKSLIFQARFGIQEPSLNEAIALSLNLNRPLQNMLLQSETTALYLLNNCKLKQML